MVEVKIKSVLVGMFGVKVFNNIFLFRYVLLKYIVFCVDLDYGFIICEKSF